MTADLRPVSQPQGANAPRSPKPSESRFGPRPKRRDLIAAVAASALGGGASAVEHCASGIRSTPPLRGLKQSRTTGSIAAGSSRLRLASPAGFVVGDNIIVELGGEASRGYPGAPGVGGCWPALSYPRSTERTADTSQAQDTFCWERDTGLVYRWDRKAGWRHDPTEPYWARVVPVALMAQVIALDSDVATLSRAASATATNATVWFDNAPVFNAAASAMGDKTELILPAGSFACGSMLRVGGPRPRAGLKILGQGPGVTVLKSPKGCVNIQLELSNLDHAEVAGLALHGNNDMLGMWGLDLKWADAANPPRWWYAVCILGSRDVVVRDCTFRDNFRAAGAEQGSERVVFRNLHAVKTGDLRYIQWMFCWINSKDCWSYDCSCSSEWITKTFHIFASNACGHVRPRAVNGVMALNSTGDCVIESPSVTIKPMSAYSHLSIPFPGTYVIDVNTNIPQNQGHGGNKILNMRIAIEGVVNAANDVPIGVNVSGHSRDTLIMGGTYAAPGYRSPSTQYGACAVNSDVHPVNTVVRGLRVVGAASDHGNINVINGAVIGCVADRIVCPGPGCSVS